MRHAALGVVVLLFPLMASAKEPTKKPTPPKTLRVSLDTQAVLDGKPVKPNGMQYFLWRCLHTYGRFRVDSARAVGHKGLDAWIAKTGRWWEKRHASSDHPVEYKIVGKLTFKYDASKFYGEAQAHNFHGRIHAEIQKPDGEKVSTFDFGFSYGKLLSSGLSKTDVQRRYEQMVFTALALAILDDPALKTRVTGKDAAKLAKWSKAEQATLLKFFDKSTKAMQKGEMAQLVRGIGKAKANKTTRKGGKKHKPPAKTGKVDPNQPCELCGEARGNASPCPHCGVD